MTKLPPAGNVSISWAGSTVTRGSPAVLGEEVDISIFNSRSDLVVESWTLSLKEDNLTQEFLPFSISFDEVTK